MPPEAETTQPFAVVELPSGEDVGRSEVAAPAAVVSGPEGAAPRLSDEDVERVARRVLELMSKRAFEDLAWEVVPDMAEVVVRDRLKELEAQLEELG
jgi:hypothetical protein